MASGRARTFFDQYTADLTTAEVRRLFTRDTADAYRYFTRNIDQKALAALPWHRRLAMRARLVFAGFTMRLSPGRRALYGVALASTLLGLILLYFEIFKATRTGSATIIDHALSLLVFIVALVEFLIVPAFAHPAFLALLLMMLIDVVAGFTVTISGARRDFASVGQ